MGTANIAAPLVLVVLGGCGKVSNSGQVGKPDCRVYTRQPTYTSLYLRSASVARLIPPMAKGRFDGSCLHTANLPTNRWAAPLVPKEC